MSPELKDVKTFEEFKSFLVKLKIARERERENLPSSITLPRVEVNNPTPASRTTAKIAGTNL